MKKLLIIILTTLTVTAFGQARRTIWDSLKTITTDKYELRVPYMWRQIPTDEKGPEQYFDASGLALPPIFNGAPVITTIFFVKQEGKNLDDCKNKCLSGYRNNPDRTFPEKFEDGQEKIKLTGGQDAYFLHTHFYRKSKGLNQSRFDLVVYSDKAKTGYLYTVSIQYASNDYKFEEDFKLAIFTKQLYSYFTWLN